MLAFRCNRFSLSLGATTAGGAAAAAFEAESEQQAYLRFAKLGSVKRLTGWLDIDSPAWSARTPVIAPPYLTYARPIHQHLFKRTREKVTQLT